MEVVNVWLRGAGVRPKTWGTLLSCLEEIKMHEAIKSIREKFLQGKADAAKHNVFMHNIYPVARCHDTTLLSLVRFPLTVLLCMATIIFQY